MLALGHARMLEYQGPAYAHLYLERLQQVLAAERDADPAGVHGFATTREMARWLALWMAFDDIVRVADLKSRATRWQRVKGEVKAGDDDLLKVYDHFKPGMPEFAALLPPALASRLVRWDRARVRKGKQPWALPLKVGTHSIFGMLALRVLAGLKWLRVRGSRYAIEQSMIDKWLAGVVQGTAGMAAGPRDRAVRPPHQGLWRDQRTRQGEPAACAGPPGAGRVGRSGAEAVAAAREAALADDAGKALDAALVQHGAPARPVKEQPIRFVRKPKSPDPKTQHASMTTTKGDTA